MSCILMCGGNQISSTKYEELLGTLIDHELTFEDQLLNIVQRINQRVHAFTKISKYMPQKKLKITIKVFVTSRLTCFTLIWMFHSRRINHKINNLHKRALRIKIKIWKLENCPYLQIR